jgi:hypothetical protein
VHSCTRSLTHCCTPQWKNHVDDICLWIDYVTATNEGASQPAVACFLVGEGIGASLGIEVLLQRYSTATLGDRGLRGQVLLCPGVLRHRETSSKIVDLSRVRRTRVGFCSLP